MAYSPSGLERRCTAFAARRDIVSPKSSSFSNSKPMVERLLAIWGKPPPQITKPSQGDGTKTRRGVVASCGGCAVYHSTKGPPAIDTGRRHVKHAILRV